MMLGSKDPEQPTKKHVDIYDKFPLSVPKLMCSKAWLIPNTEYFVAIGSFDYAFHKTGASFWGYDTDGEQIITNIDQGGTGLINGKPDGFSAYHYGIFGHLPFIVGKKINDTYIPMFATTRIIADQQINTDVLGDNYVYYYSFPYAINLVESPYLSIDTNWNKPSHLGKYPYVNISIGANILVHCDTCKMIRRSKEYAEYCGFEYDDGVPYVSDSTGTYTAYLHYDEKNVYDSSNNIITFHIPTSTDSSSINYKSILYNGISYNAANCVYNEKIYNTYNDLRKVKEDMYEFLNTLTSVAHTMKDESVTKLAFEEEIAVPDDYYAPFTYVNESDTTYKKIKSERPLLYIN